MAAYAALVSLLNIMEQIKTHPRHSFSFDKNQMESLGENVGFLLDFLECYSQGSSKEAEALESQIASAAYEAEDVIESHVVDQIHAGSTLNGNKISRFLVGLQKIIEDMDSIKKMAVKVKAQNGNREKLPTYSKPSTSSRPLVTGKNAMVGFDDELIQLMERLTAQESNRQIIPIVGMGGIGKTTLARNVYEHLVIVQHFDFRIWATISQEYNVKEILSELLSCREKSTSQTVDELGEQLYKSLSGRRYLIILDDMWSTKAWDEIKLFLPDNGNRSRIAITTRLSDMAIHLRSSSFAMNFLNEDKNWKLFCEKAFGEEDCPRELEEIGKKIVKKCKGLPLSTVVIGGHLRNSSRTMEYWENVANDINSILNSEKEEQCLGILSLSYSYLPLHLKPCFLYMGIFPEDKKISVSGLIKLWVAEGFLKPNNAQTLEEVAEGYLKDLVDRNLILVHKWSSDGKIETCNIHDLLRELCLRVAEKEKFFCVLDTPRAMHRERHVIIRESIPEEKHNPEVFHALKSARLVRSLKCEGGTELLFEFRLLRVLDWVEESTGEFYAHSLDAHFQQVNLRFIKYSHLNYIFFSPPPCPFLYLPSTISLLWNLQTLIITGYCVKVIVPSEIWEMPLLRHLELDLICLPDPLPSDRLDQQDDFVLRNLHTLLTASNFRLSEEVCRRIANVRKMSIMYEYDDLPSECEVSPHLLGRFHKLESLDLSFSEGTYWRDFALCFTFPGSLEQLSLTNSFLDWEDLTMIGSLPHLQVFKLLGWNPVAGPEWNPVEGEFCHLKSLELICCDNLICWNADSSHFPVLESLVLLGMTKLDEIPLGIGEIPTLRFIDSSFCSVSAAISAMRIVVEQESLGNEGLQLQVRFSTGEERASFQEMMQTEGLTSNNLRLDH